MTTILAGDIGGTKTSLGLFFPEAGPREPLMKETYASAAYPDLESMIGDFLGKTGLPIDAACFGVAGPVAGGKARLTNLPWSIEEGHLSRVLGIPILHLLNDLAATAESLPLLREGDELFPLKKGTPDPHGNRAIIAPGTGLGEAFSVWDGEIWQAYASEGGHCDFAPRNDTEAELWRFLRETIGHVSYESVCSGLGIGNIYRFLKETKATMEPPWLSEQLSQTDDPTPVIVQNALDANPGADICRQALDIFIAVLGAEAGNLALKVLATGGVYLGGGLPPRILPLLGGEDFLKSFTAKGRFEAFMDLIPIRVILRPDAALIGAAHHGLALTG